MSRSKIIFWVLIFALLAVLFFQNKDFFVQQNSIQVITYVSPALPTGVYCLIFFAAGLVIAYFSSLVERFRLRKTIKQLNAALPPEPPQAPQVPVPAADSLSAEIKTDDSEKTTA